MLDLPENPDGPQVRSDSEIGDAGYRARHRIEGLVLAAAGSLLAAHAAPEVFEAFARTRLGGDWGHLYGTLPAGVDTGAIIEPAIPV